MKMGVGGTNHPVVRLIGLRLVLQYVCPTAIGSGWTQSRVSLREGDGWQILDALNAYPQSRPLLEEVLRGSDPGGD